MNIDQLASQSQLIWIHTAFKSGYRLHIRLPICPGWSEPLLVGHMTLEISNDIAYLFIFYSYVPVNNFSVMSGRVFLG